jgi:AbrB family looped-hinge helix DNA binding protein
MSKLMETINMALMRVRAAAQLTLPAEVRKALNVKEGDYLEARVVEGGVLLTPVSMVERKLAWQGIVAATAKVRDRKPSGKSLRADEKAIAREVKAARRKHA